MLDDQLVFIVDLNEIEDGDVLPVSLDYTVNSGPDVLQMSFPAPNIGSAVLVHSDDDDTIYNAEVIAQVSDRDFKVRVTWQSRAPVLNGEWRVTVTPIESVMCPMPVRPSVAQETVLA